MNLFLSYSPADREWASHLALRIEGIGCNVFPHEYAPGASGRPAWIDAALSGSQAAVVVLSVDATRQAVWNSELAALQQRSAGDASFRRFAVQIDAFDARFWTGGPVFDFTVDDDPAGDSFVALRRALFEPAPGAAPGPAIDDGETRATDELVGEIRAAAASGFPQVMKLWKNLDKTVAGVRTASLFLAEEMIGMARHEEALSVLEASGDGLRAGQLRALALAKTGDVDESIRILSGLWNGGHRDGETGGLLGGRYKQKWRKSGDGAFLQASYQAYLEAWNESADTYPGINAADLALQLNRVDESRRIAEQIIDRLRNLPVSEMDRWKFATRAGAHLLLGNLEKAAEWFGRAVAANPSAVESIATMRRQARMTLEALKRPGDALDGVLAVRRVVAFTGHRVDAADRSTPRFPADSAGAVRLDIRHRLRELGAGFGVSSAADGGDLLFLEELLELGGSARVFLPFPRADFARTSIAPGWTTRFQRVLADPRVTVSVMSEIMPDAKDLEAAFTACNEQIRASAVEFADSLDQMAILLAVWNGEAGDGVGGTADAVRAFQDEGLTVDVIDPMKPAGALAPARTAPSKKRNVSGIIVETSASPPARLISEYRKKHCLCIGIGNYEQLPKLANPIHDATEMAETLETRFGFQPRLLLDEAATGEGIAAAIQNDLKTEAHADDLVVLFFAGHGKTREIGPRVKGYIAPVDAPARRWSKLISMEQLVDWSTALASRHVLYVFDSCFSGTLVLRSDADRRTQDMLARRARIAITAGGADQEVVDGGWKNHSVFTGHLLQGLQKSVGMKRKDFTATELYSYLALRVPEEAPQTPSFGMMTDHEGGDILFTVLSRSAVAPKKKAKKKSATTRGAATATTSKRRAKNGTRKTPARAAKKK